MSFVMVHLYDAFIGWYFSIFWYFGIGWYVFIAFIVLWLIDILLAEWNFLIEVL